MYKKLDLVDNGKWYYFLAMGNTSALYTIEDGDDGYAVKRMGNLIAITDSFIGAQHIAENDYQIKG